MNLQSDLQAAVFQALTTDATLENIIGRPHAVYDTIPDKRQFPFVVFGQTDDTNWSTDNCAAVQSILTISVWSRAKNRAEIYAISDRLNILLSGLSGGYNQSRIVLTTPVSAAYSRQEDARAFLAVLRFRVLIEPLVQ